jgi:hypothetical protein
MWASKRAKHGPLYFIYTTDKNICPHSKYVYQEKKSGKRLVVFSSERESGHHPEPSRKSIPLKVIYY